MSKVIKVTNRAHPPPVRKPELSGSSGIRIDHGQAVPAAAPLALRSAVPPPSLLNALRRGGEVAPNGVLLGLPGVDIFNWVQVLESSVTPRLQFPDHIFVSEL